MLPFTPNLTGKVAVVTGGGGVLCGTMSKALAECGAAVAVTDLRQEAADTVVEEITQNGGTAIGIACNVLEPDTLEAAAETIERELGICDILINGAGGNHPDGTAGKESVNSAELIESLEGSFFKLSPEGIGFALNLNYLGTVLSTQAFAKSMAKRGGGTIVNISSMTSLCPLTKVMSYGGAKAAVNNFTQWLAVHLAPCGIRVNAIAPGFFLTEQNYSLLMTEADRPTPRCQTIIDQTPMKRLGKPEELLGSLLYLVHNDASSFVSGTVMPVDGGFSAFSGV